MRNATIWGREWCRTLGQCWLTRSLMKFQLIYLISDILLNLLSQGSDGKCIKIRQGVRGVHQFWYFSPTHQSSRRPRSVTNKNKKVKNIIETEDAHISCKFWKIVQGTRPLWAIILVKFEFFSVLGAVNPQPWTDQGQIWQGGADLCQISPWSM